MVPSKASWLIDSWPGVFFLGFKLNPDTLFSVSGKSPDPPGTCWTGWAGKNLFPLNCFGWNYVD